MAALCFIRYVNASLPFLVYKPTLDKILIINQVTTAAVKLQFGEIELAKTYANWTLDALLL